MARFRNFYNLQKVKTGLKWGKKAQCVSNSYKVHLNQVIVILKLPGKLVNQQNLVELLFIVKVFVSDQVMFDAVGGLNKQIRALKEMVLFPLMYPEVFEKFKISPPRGVLFHGPPGKTVFVLFLLKT